MTAFNRTLPLRSLGILLVLGACLHAQNALKITNPTAGTVFHPGESVVVNVSASGAAFTSVTIIAPGYVNGSAALSSPPYQFSFKVPPIPSPGIRPGINTIGIMGATVGAAGPVFTGVSIDIERSDSPVSISTDTSGFGLRIGEKVPVQVYGTYSDGSIVDLNRSAQTTYTIQNPSIVTVDAAGFVTAVAPGSTMIVVRHQNLQRTVPVTVTRAPK
jgi:hypothetical protein